MLYWLGVYLLVTISVAVSFLLLYCVGILFWLAVTGMGVLTRTLRNALLSVTQASPNHAPTPRCNSRA